MNVITWKQYLKDIDKLASKITEKFDYIWGIPRGGLIPAVILAHKLDIPLVSDRKMLSMRNDYKLLIVDDLYETGKALCEAIAMLPSKVSWRSAVVYTKADKEIAHYSGPLMDKDAWIVFPYEKVENAETDSVEYQLSRKDKV